MTTTTSPQAALTPVIEPHTQRWLDEPAAASAGSPPLWELSLEDARQFLIINGEHDVLRDEGEAYARKLSQGDVPVTQVRYGGTIHDFVLLNPITGIPAPGSHRAGRQLPAQRPDLLTTTHVKGEPR